MDALERDYRTVLLANHEPPNLSLYQPTHRSHPDKQQNQIRYRNLVKELKLSLERKYSDRESAPILRPFYDLSDDVDFWNYVLESIAIFATSNFFKVYRLRRPVRELALVADSFHTKPLMRILQSSDRYLVLGSTGSKQSSSKETAMPLTRSSWDFRGQLPRWLVKKKVRRNERTGFTARPGQAGRHVTARMFVKKSYRAKPNAFSGPWTRQSSSSTPSHPACPYCWQHSRSTSICSVQ